MGNWFLYANYLLLSKKSKYACIYELAAISETRNKMKAVRLILILLVGGLVTYLTYKTKYQTFFFEVIIWCGLILIGIIVFLWTVIKDFQLFKTTKRFSAFELTLLCIFFIALILTLERQINNNFNKPTLLKAFYDGGYNGTGFDLKTDGTYIFDNSAIGISDYFYGTYKIKGNKITMDRDKINNLPNLKFLEIRDNKIVEGATNLYLFQVDSLGQTIDSLGKYRITIDNRNR